MKGIGSMKKSIYLFTLIMITILFLGFLSWGGEIKRCIVCGMDVLKYPHTRYVVTAKEGEEFVACGVQCGLTLHLRLKEKFKSAMATDLLSNRPFDAQKGFYVYKSSVITDMAPGFIAFSTREKAENFAKGFGGRVVTYQEALEIWKGQMK
jgi:nitrous oxide reductase accessory protein NosL